jgi:hypothetical protein
MKLIEPIFELNFAVQIMIEPIFLHLPNFTQNVGYTYNRGHNFLIKILIIEYLNCSFS